MKFICNSVVVVLLALGLVACSPNTSNLTIALNAVVDASSVCAVVAASLNATGNLSDAAATAVEQYSEAEAQAAQAAIIELRTKDTNTVKIAIITTAFTNIAKPLVAANISPQAAGIIQAVDIAVKAFLRMLNNSQNLMLAQAAPHASISLSRADRASLKKAAAKAHETAVRSSAWLAGHAR